MKIDDVHTSMTLVNSSQDTGAVNRVDARDESVSGPKGSPDASTQVDLSNKSVESRKAAEMMQREPAERSAKVNEIKAKILNNEYQVDSGEVAEKIFKEVLLDYLT